jgi:class 3 adenylate cyclase
VAPQIVGRLLADPGMARLGGALQTVTVLFADLRGYTALAEKLAADQLVDVLNGHLTVAAEAILANEGTISQFTGDQVMAFFNAPCPQPDHALLAARSALQLRRKLSSYHIGLPEHLRMRFGVGIVTGEALVGNIGAGELWTYTAIGDTVNLAQRLEELAQGGEILLSESTALALDGLVQTQSRGLTPIRGRSEHVTVYTLLGQSPEESK